MSEKKPQALKEQENFEKDAKTKEFSKTRKHQITINNPTKHGYSTTTSTEIALKWNQNISVCQKK